MEVMISLFGGTEPVIRFGLQMVRIIGRLKHD